MNMRSPFVRLLLATIVFLFSVHSQAETYQWKDGSGRVYYSDKQSVVTAKIQKISPTPPNPALAKLDVPLIKQGNNRCGPTIIEMLFRYWSVDDYDQYYISYNRLNQFQKVGERIRYVSNDPFERRFYPCAETINMREFLKHFATIENSKPKKYSSGCLPCAKGS